MPRTAWVVGSVMVAALLAPSAGLIGSGVGEASAATSYFTRKKVNGRWVTGRFPSTRTAAAPAAASNPVADGQVSAASAEPAAGTTPTTGPTARRVRFSERKGLAKARYSSLPKYRSRVVLRTTGSPDVAEAKPAVSVPVPAPQPVVQAAPPSGPSRDAAVSNANGRPAFPPHAVTTTASIAPAAPVPPGGERMRSALEARARSMASELGIPSVPLPAAAVAAQLPARSVTFDLQRGLRTVVFEDGTAVTAPFDPAKAERATGLPAAR